MSTNISLLAEVPLFQLMDDEERAVLASHISVVRSKAGEMLFEAGDPGDCIYVIRSGEVEIYIRDTTGRRIVLENAGVGKFVGELSLLDGGPRTASVIVTEDLEALKIDREDLNQLFSAHPAAAMDFLAAMGKRLRASSDLLKYSVSRNANYEDADSSTRLQKLADQVTAFSGSMTFLILHVVFFPVWIFLNMGYVSSLPIFDPYPYSFLTTAVSLEAIILSIFVLLSQNRQAAKDRVRADIEYDVNLKAELEIQHLHTKMDQMNAQLLAKISQMDSWMSRIEGILKKVA